MYVYEYFYNQKFTELMDVVLLLYITYTSTYTKYVVKYFKSGYATTDTSYVIHLM